MTLIAIRNFHGKSNETSFNNKKSQSTSIFPRIEPTDIIHIKNYKMAPELLFTFFDVPCIYNIIRYASQQNLFFNKVPSINSLVGLTYGNVYGMS